MSAVVCFLWLWLCLFVCLFVGLVQLEEAWSVRVVAGCPREQFHVSLFETYRRSDARRGDYARGETLHGYDYGNYSDYGYRVGYGNSGRRLEEAHDDDDDVDVNESFVTSSSTSPSLLCRCRCRRLVPCVPIAVVIIVEWSRWTVVWTGQFPRA